MFVVGFACKALPLPLFFFVGPSALAGSGKGRNKSKYMPSVQADVKDRIQPKIKKNNDSINFFSIY